MPFSPEYEYNRIISGDVFSQDISVTTPGGNSGTSGDRVCIGDGGGVGRLARGGGDAAAVAHARRAARDTAARAAASGESDGTARGAVARGGSGTAGGSVPGSA